MAEKEPQFTVSDRRKFTLDGDLREGQASPQTEAPPPPPPPPTPASAQPTTVPEAAAPVAGAEPAGKDGSLNEPSAAETAQQSLDYQASSKQLDELLRDAHPGEPPVGEMNFERLVQFLYMTAAMQMGAGTPANEQPRIDIIGARQSIDMLSTLGEKTKGNLTEEETGLLQNALFDLRMSFLEITNAIAGSAQRTAEPKRR